MLSWTCLFFSLHFSFSMYILLFEIQIIQLAFLEFRFLNFISRNSIISTNFNDVCFRFWKSKQHGLNITKQKKQFSFVLFVQPLFIHRELYILGYDFPFIWYPILRSWSSRVLQYQIYSMQEYFSERFLVVTIWCKQSSRLHIQSTIDVPLNYNDFRSYSPCHQDRHFRYSTVCYGKSRSLCENR